MNNSLGFLLGYKSAEGLPKNKRLLYGILGAQAPAGDLSQVALPVLLAKREVKNLPQPSPTSTSGEQPPQEESEPITLKRLEEFVERFKQQQQEQQQQEREEERIKAMYECLEDCLEQIKARQVPKNGLEEAN